MGQDGKGDVDGFQADLDGGADLDLLPIAVDEVRDRLGPPSSSTIATTRGSWPANFGGARGGRR
jgi:hypothetical protein